MLPLRLPGPFADQNRPVVTRALIVLAALLLFLAQGVAAATIDKANNTNALNLTSSWVGGVVPGTNDAAQWSGTVTGATTVALGANLSWDALKVLNPGGAITISAGNTLTLNSSNTALDLALAAQDATVACVLALPNDNTWNVTNGRVLTLSGGVNAAGSVIAKNGAGTVILNGGAVTASTLDVNAGKVQLAAGSLTTSGGSGAYGYLVVSGGSIFEQLGGSLSSPAYVCVGQSGSGSTLDLKGGSFNAGADLLIGYAASGTLNVSGTASVTAGTLRFGQAAAATINLNGGSLGVDTWNSPNGGTLNLNGTRFSYTGNGGDIWNAGNVTANVSTNGAWFDVPLALTLGQPLLHLSALGASADGGLRKSSAGTLTLTATNTYTGPTTVSNGTLVVNGRLSGTSLVTVNSGVTLAGTGVISGAVVIRDNATVAAAAAPLTVGGLTLSNAAVLNLQLGTANAGTNAAIRVNGNLVLDGQWLISDAGGLAAGQTLAAIYYTGTLTNAGVSLHPLSAWEVALDTNTPRVVKLVVVRKFPFIEFTQSSLGVTTLSTNLSVILHGTTAKALWYEVRDAAGRLWDYGSHAGSSPWSFNVRHLREGTNTVTVFGQPSTGGIASNSLQLTLALDAATPVRPRPVPAEVWWGGSCHDDLYDTNGNITGTYSRIAQLTNTTGWDYVKQWQDGFMLHGYVWVNGVAKMTNRSMVGPAIAAQLSPYRARYILEDAWRPVTNNMNYGHSSATGQSGNATTLESLGFYISDVTQDYNPQYRDFSEWHPEWPTNNLRVASTGNTNDISAGYPYASGQWRDFASDYASLRPNINVGWTWSPVWFSWSNGLSLGTDNGIFTVTQNGTNYPFRWNFYDFMKDAWLVGNAAGLPFTFASDCPYEYYLKYPGNPGGWTQAQQAANRQKIRNYEAWLWARGSRHVQICNSYDGGSTVQDTWDLNYRNQSLAVMYLHQQEGGRAFRYLFESWYAGPYTMLPETKEGAYANLARDAIRFIKGISTNGTAEPLRLYVLNTGAVVNVMMRNEGTFQCLPVLQVFASGAGTLTVTNAAGANITSAALSAEGYAHTNMLQPGQSTTFALAVTGSPASKTVTLEAFWNPQDPTGVVRDRVTLVLPPAAAPFTGIAATVPGTIQAENFDTGGEGVAYHDTTLTNQMNQYRALEGVDIETCSDTGGGYSVGAAVATEWLQYTVSATTSGTNLLELRIASNGTGGVCHVEIDGVNVTGPISIANTGGWQTWQTFSRSNIFVSLGTHVVRLMLDTNGPTGYIGNFNWLRFTTLVTNQPPVVVLTAPASGAFVFAGTNLPLAATATDSDGAVQRVSFYVDATKIGDDLTAPYAFTWTNATLGMHTLFATATDNGGVIGTSAPVSISVVLTSAVTSVISTGSVWRFRDDAVDLGAAWRSNSYNDAGWKSGAAMLGFGDANGVLPQTIVASNGQWTTYFRQSFILGDTSLVQSASARMQRDDGAVIYLNGAEIWRSNMPLPPTNITYAAPAITAISGPGETAWYTNAIPASLLLLGTNVLAAEVHQNTNNSSDIAFDFALDLTAYVRATPTLTLSGLPPVATWPASNGLFTIFTATNLITPVTWTRATNAVVFTNGEYRLPLTGPGQRYFRLQAQ